MTTKSPMILGVLRRTLKLIFYASVISFSWAMSLYLRSDVLAPRTAPTSFEWEKAKSQAAFYSKDGYGINHAFLSGSPFERGLAWGSLTKDLLYRQERTLVDMYSDLIPSTATRKVFETGLIAVFQGLELVFSPWMLEEMWGVSQSASADFNSFASPYARQLAYHGIHEIGQLFVDLAPLEGACTFVSFPFEKNWLVGRTFDFEGGRIFDEEKIIKWVYPDKGFKYVSVIWAGMVGAVSGVNEKGIYVSINAAGSRDVNLRGLPSTLLVTKVLQEAETLEDALKIFRDTDSMITDIYMVLDSKSGRLFKVEKSAFNLDMSEVKTATAVANHLESEVFRQDEFNLSRRIDFTSTFRQERAQELLNELHASHPKSTEQLLHSLLKILRDKGINENSEQLHLGNRRAIDALIAAHGVLFDAHSQILYVSEGPSMVGAFRAYDLTKSFAQQKPVERRGLIADPKVSKETYFELKEKLSQLKETFVLLRRNRCQEAFDELNSHTFEHVEYYYAATLASRCLNKEADALAFAKKGLSLSPPHKALTEYFETVVEGAAL